MHFAPIALYPGGTEQVAVMFDLRAADARRKLDALRAAWPGLALFHLDANHVVAALRPGGALRTEDGGHGS
jgi:hypothetical protein